MTSSKFLRQGSCLFPAVCLLLLAVTQPLSGQDQDVLSFRDYLEKVREHRGEIKSYDLTVTGEVRNVPSAVVLTDGKAHVNARILHRYVLEMARDTERNMEVTARKEWYTRVSEDNAYERTQGVSPWLLNIRHGDVQIIREHHFENAIARAWRPPASRQLHPGQFDPLALGLAMGEHFIGGDLETILSNYSDRADVMSASPIGNGLVQFGRGPSWQMVADTERGYWPLSLQYEDARTRTRFEITVDKVHEVWLPVAVHVMSSSQDAVLQLEWHSINEPLPEERVSFDEIQKRYECTIEDQRAR
jgi:hypothetical protein